MLRHNNQWTGSSGTESNLYRDPLHNVVTLIVIIIIPPKVAACSRLTNEVLSLNTRPISKNGCSLGSKVMGKFAKKANLFSVVQ